MKQEIRDRWTAALRSGQYKQGKFKFEADGKFCCLGVLCDVMGQPTERVGLPATGNWPFVNPLVGSPRTASELAHLNDSEGLSFAEIADWIEHNIEVTP